MPTHDFIGHWKDSNASERANYQLFLGELCQLLGVPERDGYVFERPVSVVQLDGSSTTNFIDLYRRGSFVLEAKQGSAAHPDPTGPRGHPQEPPSPQARPRPRLTQTG